MRAHTAMNSIKYLMALIYFDARRFLASTSTKSPSFRRSVQESSNYDLRSVMKTFHKNGFVVIPNYWPEEKCSTLVKELDALFSVASICNVLNDDIRIYDTQNHSKIAYTFFSDEQLKQISKLATGLNLKNYGSMANRVDPRKSHLGSGGDWHRDSNYSQFKTLIYLTEVSEVDDGAFQIIRKTNGVLCVLRSNLKVRKKLTETRWTNSEIEKRGSKYKISTVTGKAGSLVIFDTSNLHRGAPNRNKSRYALTNYYYSNLTHQQYGQKVENAK